MLLLCFKKWYHLRKDWNLHGESNVSSFTLVAPPTFYRSKNKACLAKGGVENVEIVLELLQVSFYILFPATAYFLSTLLLITADSRLHKFELLSHIITPRLKYRPYGNKRTKRTIIYKTKAPLYRVKCSS